MPLSDLLRWPSLRLSSASPLRPRLDGPAVAEEDDPLADIDRQLGRYDPLADIDRTLAQTRAAQPKPPQPPSFDFGVGPVSTLDKFGYQPRVELQPSPPPPAPTPLSRPFVNPKTGSVLGPPPPLGEGIVEGAVGTAWNAVKGGFGLARAGAHAITSAYGEEFGALPGHENEPKDNAFGVPIGRLQEHAKKLWATGGADMHPQDPVVSKTSDSVWHMTPAQRDLWKRRGRPDPGEWHTPTADERTADEVARGVMNDAFNILTDPATHALAGVSGITTKMLGYAFATEGVKNAYATLNDPEASRADKLLSLIHGTLMAGPVVTHAVLEHGPTVARTVGPPVMEGAAVAGKTAATAGAAALSPFAKLMRETILAAKVGLPNITRAAPEAFGAGTRAPMTAMERVGGSELPGNLPGSDMGEIPGAPRVGMLRNALERNPGDEALALNETKPPPVTVPEAIAPGVRVTTPTGSTAWVVDVETPTHGTPRVLVQHADGSHATFRPDVLTVTEPLGERGIMQPPTETPTPTLTRPEPELTQPELGLETPAPPTPSVLPKKHGELRADTLEKAHELQRERTAATGLPHTVIEAPTGFIVSAGGVETPSARPPAKPDESVRDYQRRARVPFAVAQEMVDAARGAPAEPSPRVVAPPPNAATAAVEEQPSLFGDEPAAPDEPTAAPAPAPAPTPAASFTHKGRDFDVTFANPIDAALYNASVPKASPASKQQLAALSERTGASGAHLQAQGVELRAAVKAQAENAAPGVTQLAVPASDFSLPYAHAVESPGAPNAREADNRGPRGDTRAAATAVPAAARPGSARPSAPEVAARPALTEAHVNAVAAHPRFRGFRVSATPEGHIAIHPPSGLPVIGQMLAPGEFPSSFDSEHGVASFVAEANATGTTHYTMGGGTRVTRHALPTTLAEFKALPPSHQEKLRSRFVVVGRYNPDTDTLHINEAFAHDPDVWAEEHFHAGVARMTPQEKKDAKVETKAQEEAAFREGWQIPPEIYSRQPGNLGTLGDEGQPHGRQETETRANAGAPRQEGHDGAVQEAQGTPADARGDRRSGAGVYGVRDRAAAAPSDELADDKIREAVGSNFARLLASILDPDGGFTYSPISGSPTKGYALSVTKAAEAVFAPSDITPKVLADYIRQHKVALSDPRNYIGAWHNPDDGKAYLDISTVVQARGEAERLGLEHNQLAYYDLVQGRSIKREDWDAVRRAGPVVQRLTEPSYGTRLSNAGVRESVAEQKLYEQAAIPGGGVTWSPVSGSPPGEGYVIGTKPSTAAVFTPSQFTPKAFADFVRANFDALKSGKNYIRVWNNKSGKKRIYLDIAQVVKTPAEAQRLGVKHGRTHYLNLKTGEVNRTWLGQEQFEAEKVRKETVAEGNMLPRQQRAPHEFVDGHLYLSARMPKGPEAVENDDVLYARLSVLDDETVVSKEAKQKYVDYAWNKLGLLTDRDREEVKGDGDAILDRSVTRTMDNLRWLWDRMATAPKFTEEIRERARQWYRGAHRIATRIAKEEGFTRQQVAGVFAALSPQMDWFKNVDLGRRVIALYKKLSAEDAVFTTDLMNKFQAEARAKAVTSMKSAAANARKKKKAFDGDEYLYDKGVQYDRERKQYEGKSWSEMDDYGRALLLRTFDENSKTRAYDGDTELNGRAYQIIAPEGTIGSYMLTTGGASAKTGWGNYDAITNAIAILRDKSHANIDVQLGDEHKVRSFFNNIENPESADFVTVDTHAVAANHLLPLSGEDPFVRATLGGSPSTAPAGLSGVNIIEAEAYFRLAAQLSKPVSQGGIGRPVLPREVQSVTWEGIRLLYKPDQKRGDDGEQLRKDADALQAQYQGGTLSLNDYHAAIEQLAGGFELPSWAATRDETTADQGGVSEADAARGRPDVSAARGDRVGGAKGTRRRAADQPGRDVSEGVRKVDPSYGVRDTAAAPTLERLEREARARGESLADAVAQARADGRDIDVSAHFNLGRVELPDEEVQALKDHIIDTAVAFGRVPKPDKMSFDEVRREAQELNPKLVETQLERFLPHQAPSRALRDAARHRINELSREIYTDTKALATVPIENKAEREQAEADIAEKTETIQKLLSTWMKIRSEDGRNLAMHRMMSDSVGWQWGDKTYWFGRAKRELGLPQGVELPPEVLGKLNDILERGAEAQAEAGGAPSTEQADAPGSTAAPPSAEPDAATPPVEEEAAAPVEQRGPMTRRPVKEGPVLPPLESRGGSMTRGPRVEGPVLPPEPSRGPMTRGPAVQGPVLPPREPSRGDMTRSAPRQGPVLPPRESAQQGASKARGPAPFRLTPPPGDPKPTSKMHGPPLSYPERKGKKPTAKETAVQLELADYLVKLRKTDWLEAALLLRKAGFLTGIPTHARNFGGNLGFQVQDELARIPGAFSDTIISLGTGKRTVHRFSPMAMAKSSYYAATEGVKEAKAVMRGGDMTAAEKLKTGAHRELNTGKPWLDNYANFVFRSLSASDRIFKSYAFRRSLEAQAWLQAKNVPGGPSAKETVSDKLALYRFGTKPTDAMLARAIADAEFATFNNKNVASAMWQQMLNTGKRLGPEGKVIATALDTVVPFTNTPANIFEIILDGTGVTLPFKLPLAAYRGYKASRSGGAAPPPPDPPFTGSFREKKPKPPTAAATNKAAAAKLAKEALTPSQQEIFSMVAGRGSIGMALMLLGGWMAAKGLATGMADEDEGTRNVKEAAGLQPGSIKVGDKWRQIGSFAPWGSMIVLGASMYERDSWAKRGAAASKVVLEQPMMAGAKEAMEGIEKFDTAGERFATNWIGGNVPSVVSNAAASFDPYRRETRPEGDVLTRGVATRTPGWRNKLPQRTDIFGAPMTEAVGRFYDPTTPTKDKRDDVTRALLRLHIGVGRPDKVPESDESPRQYRERVVATGQAIRSALEAAVAQDDFNSLTDEQQAERLEQAIADGRSQYPRPARRKAAGQ